LEVGAMGWSESWETYLAGHGAPPGCYRRVEPPDGRIVELQKSDVLPASLDGRVAVYVRVQPAQVRRTPPGH
jgi:hypothetical protein